MRCVGSLRGWRALRRFSFPSLPSYNCLCSQRPFLLFESPSDLEKTLGLVITCLLYFPGMILGGARSTLAMMASVCLLFPAQARTSLECPSASPSAHTPPSLRGSRDVCSPFDGTAIDLCDRPYGFFSPVASILTPTLHYFCL